MLRISFPASKQEHKKEVMAAGKSKEKKSKPLLANKYEPLSSTPGIEIENTTKFDNKMSIT